MKGWKIPSIFILFTVLGCVSQQRIVETPPFEIKAVTYRTVIAGQEASTNQLELRMGWKVESGYIIIPDTIYFKGNAAVTFIETTVEGKALVATFNLTKQIKGDLIMDANGLKEVGNQPSFQLSGTKGLAFELADNEALLSYRIAGKKRLYYYKVTGIIEKQPLIMPSRPH